MIRVHRAPRLALGMALAVMAGCSGGGMKDAEPSPTPAQTATPAAQAATPNRTSTACALGGPQGPVTLRGTREAGKLRIEYRAEEPVDALIVKTLDGCWSLPAKILPGGIATTTLKAAGEITVYLGGPAALVFTGPGAGAVRTTLSLPTCHSDGVLSKAGVELNWAACDAEQECVSGRCVCPNTCAEEGRECGFDSCGHDCGQCPGEWPCSATGRCEQ